MQPACRITYDEIAIVGRYSKRCDIGRRVTGLGLKDMVREAITTVSSQTD